MKSAKQIVLMAAIAAMGSASAMAGTTTFTYNVKGDEPMNLGYEIKQTYDVAIRIDNPSLVGTKITGLSVAVPEAGASEWSGWLSSELKLEKKKNVPDICSTAATPADGVLNVTFDTPYTITADGVYVGYTLTVNEVMSYETENPVTVVYGENPNGFFIHASRSQLKWTSLVERTGLVSAMTVNLEGDFHQYAANATIAETVYSAVGQKGTFNVVVNNHGSEPVETIDYSYTLSNGAKGNGTAKVDTPIPAVWGAQGSTTVTIDAVEELGSYEMTLTVDRINGNENKDAVPAVNSTLKVIPFVPVNRPLVEEYTGLWCGYCPLGFVALETLNEQYPGQFLALSYHNEDPMATVPDAEYPSYIDGFPSSFVNRGIEVYPGDLFTDWAGFAAGIAQADLDVTVSWADDAKTKLVAEAACRFIEDQENSNYTVAFFLVGDNITDPAWEQSNYFAGNSSLTGKYAELFVNGGDKVTGLVFNDIVLSNECIEGTEQGLPSSFKAAEVVTDSYTFDVAAVKNLSGEDIPVDPSKLRVVAAIIDRNTGKAVNCNTSDYAPYETGIGCITAPGTQAVATEYFDLAGRRISRPAKGVTICVRHFDNGQSSTSKIIR